MFDLTAELAHAEEVMSGQFDPESDYGKPGDIPACIQAMATVSSTPFPDDLLTGWVECGSCKLPAPEKALYRLLWAFSPAQIPWGEMYGGTLFFATTRCEEFAIAGVWHKGQPALRFYAHPKDIEGNPKRIACGIPGVDNGIACINPIGCRFFDLIQRITETPQMIYAGNELKV